MNTWERCLCCYGNGDAEQPVCVQPCGPDGHAVCYGPDDEFGVERTVEQPGDEASGEFYCTCSSSVAVETLNRRASVCVAQGFSAVSPMPPMPRIQTDVSLPSLKKLAPPDSKSKERLFVVFSPSPLPPDVLEDVFW